MSKQTSQDKSVKSDFGKVGIGFIIHEVPPSLNVMLRTHWRERKRIQGLWDLWVYRKWLELDKFIFLKPVKILYILSFKHRRNRDFDNYIGGTKYITDALKRTFLLRDDSSWLTKIEIEFTEAEGVSGTVIKIEEAE